MINVSKDVYLLQNEITLKEKEIQDLQKYIKSEDNKLIELYYWTEDMLNSLEQQFQVMTKKLQEIEELKGNI
ncbi:MAG: hypothetical protein ACM3O4_04470 [Ignavibacteriales bacterium]